MRTFDAVAFRQAAGMMDQMEVTRLAALSPHDRALKLAGQAKEYLDRGLLLESERLYQSAVTADGNLAAAHVGLAQVRERTGDLAGARKEARPHWRLNRHRTRTWCWAGWTLQLIIWMKRAGKPARRFASIPEAGRHRNCGRRSTRRQGTWRIEVCRLAPVFAAGEGRRECAPAWMAVQIQQGCRKASRSKPWQARKRVQVPDRGQPGCSNGADVCMGRFNRIASSPGWTSSFWTTQSSR